MASDVAHLDPRDLNCIAFLGETKRAIPRSRPASGRAPRAGLVQDAACGTGAQRRLVLDETEHDAMLVQGGPPAPSKTAPPNGVLPVIPRERSCCDDHLNPPGYQKTTNGHATTAAAAPP